MFRKREQNGRSPFSLKLLHLINATIVGGSESCRRLFLSLCIHHFPGAPRAFSRFSRGILNLCTVQ